MINIVQHQIERSIKNLSNINYQKELVFFCVGNYKIWYDSFGPLFAEELRKYPVSAFIYGGVNYPIAPDNLTEYIRFVEQKHSCATIIVVDSRLAVDMREHMSLSIEKRSSTIGGYANSLSFGDYSILLSCCSKANFAKTKVLQNIIIKELSKKLQNNINKMHNFAKNSTNFTKLKKISATL